MKENRNIFWIFAALAILIIVLVVLLVRTNKNAPKVVTAKPTVIYRDINNNTHAQIPSSEVDKATIKHLGDSIAKLLKIKAKDIRTITQVVTITDTVFTEHLIFDSTGYFSVEHRDNYIRIRAEGSIYSDTASISYRSIDTLTYVSYVKKHLFKANDVIVDVYNKNPNTSIVSGNSIHLHQPKVLVAFGPSVGVTLRNGTIFPYIGVGMTYNIFSIKSNK